jgi:hypothetical protein
MICWGKSFSFTPVRPSSSFDSITARDLTVSKPLLSSAVKGLLVTPYSE